MSSVRAANPLIIETRRAARAKAEPFQNGKRINNLNADRDTGDRDSGGSQDIRRPRRLSCPDAECDVPLRHNENAPRLNAAFVAQLLGQRISETTPRSDVLAAYEPMPATALICDRHL